MSTAAPKPPTKRLFAAALLAAGLTLGMTVVTVLGHFVFSGIPRERLAVYVVLIAVGVTASCWLGGKYLIQRHRRDAWWEGFAAGDEPEEEDAKVIQLHGVTCNDGKLRKFIVDSPS